MADLLHSPHIVDIALLVLAAEIAMLTVLRPEGTVGERLGRLLTAALPGLFLLLALRAALAGAGWGWILACVTASFPAHLVDMWRRPP